MLCQTTVEIIGSCIGKIPKGTQFILTFHGEIYSGCSGLPINLIFNNEFEPVMGFDFCI